MTYEEVVDPVLAAVCFRDVETRMPITSPIVVTGSGVRIMRNAAGLCVLAEVAGKITQSSAPQLFRLVAKSPSGWYLPRSFDIDLQLAAPPLFSPIDVFLYPAPTAHCADGSTVLRCSVSKRVGVAEPLVFEPLNGALLVVAVKIGNHSIRAQGLSDARGEAVIFVPGIPILEVNENSNGNPFETLFDATIHVIATPTSDLLDSFDWALPPPHSTVTDVCSGVEYRIEVKIV